MIVASQIENHFTSLASSKSNELRKLHDIILSVNPTVPLWFDNGINEEGKIVTNPTIGYGNLELQYANGSSRTFFQIGICSTSTGISIYIIGLKDKQHLKNTFSEKIGKASITGYCIKFKTLKDIHESALKELVSFGFSDRKN